MSTKHVTPRDVTKELRPLMRLSLDQGWRHERTSNNHIKWISPTGGLVHSGQIRGSGDFRALRNLKSDLVKNGLRVEEEGRTVSAGCCPHGISYRELAKGIRICEACVDASKTPLGQTVQALAEAGIAGEAVATAGPTPTTLGEAIRPNGMVWIAWPRKAGGHDSEDMPVWVPTYLWLLRSALKLRWITLFAGIAFFAGSMMLASIARNRSTSPSERP